MLVVVLVVVLEVVVVGLDELQELAIEVVDVIVQVVDVDQDVDEGDLSSGRTPDKGWVNTFTYDPSTDQRVINHLKDVQKRKEKLRRSIADSYKYANPGQYLF